MDLSSHLWVARLDFKGLSMKNLKASEWLMGAGLILVVIAVFYCDAEEVKREKQQAAEVRDLMEFVKALGYVEKKDTVTGMFIVHGDRGIVNPNSNVTMDELPMAWQPLNPTEPKIQYQPPSTSIKIGKEQDDRITSGEQKHFRWNDLHEHVTSNGVWGSSPVNAQLRKDLEKVFPKGKRPEATCIYPDGTIGLALQDGTEVALPKTDNLTAVSWRIGEDGSVITKYSNGMEVKFPMFIK